MLRFFFWIFLLLNLGLLAINLGYLGDWQLEKHEPARLKLESNPDRLQLMSADAFLALQENKEKPREEKTMCIEVGQFSSADVTEFEDKLKPLSLLQKTKRDTTVDVATHMVFIPSLGSKDGAEKKAIELKRLGVNDFFIVQDQSILRWGISLGVFRTEDAAKTHLANLTSKGVKTAKIGTRTVNANKFSFQFRDLGEAEQQSLATLLKSFPNQAAQNCQANGSN
jgi:hypothetical protein